MTAPDPGLTDLIAAHKIQLFGVDGPHYQAETEYDGCLCGWRGAEEDHPAHVALVVEQHTNGRMASDLGADPQDYEIAWAAKLRWQARAEKAEATNARVKDAVSGLPACDKYEPDDVISCGWKNAVVEVIAALEGEQQ